jgi:hypothetical protein
MVRPTVQTQSEAKRSEAAENRQGTSKVLESEIECPRCNDRMLLVSEFDNLYYFCEECDFCLFTIKRG